MRVLFYLHRFPAIGGIEHVTAFLANAFTQIGFEVEIVAHVSVPEQDAANALNKRVQVYKMPQSRYFSFSNRKWLQQRIRMFQPDLVIFQDSYAPIERNLFVRELSVPVLVCEHNSPYVCYADFKSKSHHAPCFIRELLFWMVANLKYARDRCRRRYLYKKCWRYVLLSERFYGEFKAVARIDEIDKLRAIPNACKTPVDERIEDKCNEIVFVGALNKRKGCDALLRVWLGISCRWPGWKLVFVGDGPSRESLEAMAGRDSSVAFEGFQNDPSPYYRRAKILAFASRREGWGLVIAEAMSHGCVPIVFDSFSAVRDLILDGQVGVLVPAFDEQSFSDKLEKLLGDVNGLALMAKNARESVRRYEDRVIIGKWLELLTELRK